MLSGGQRQRVALARGLYAWTPDDRGVPLGGRVLLMLDDVLSAVDHATEHVLIETMHALKPRPTTIIVANRISAIQHAAVILVMANGRIVDQGTHDELISRAGPYLETWQRQSEEAS
jgi:ABC-type multidrug transport system fused ATPase/permease subunit